MIRTTWIDGLCPCQVVANKLKRKVNMSLEKYRIVLLNQMAGPLFRELAEDLAKIWSQSLLYTGHPDTLQSPASIGLSIKAAPAYDRSSNPKRLLSWFRYFFGALWVTARQPSDALLFIVSNPPFLGLLGLLFKIIRRQQYVVLVYDVYPDLLVELGTIRKGLFSQIWTLLNRLVMTHASVVFAIGDDMAHLLEDTYDIKRTNAGHVIVIPNWADVDSVRPLEKHQNWFAIEHDQVGKITALYSGNMGNTHDIESLIAVARELKDHETLRFLFIGSGAKWSLVEKTLIEEGLKNITLLPFQPEEVLPFSMASGDIGFVTYQSGTEACIVPSKSYYYMAAGLVPLVISSRETDLSRMLVKNNCGLSVRTGDIEGIKQVLLTLAADRERLDNYKIAARAKAELEFSRQNTEQFIRAINQFIVLN